MMNILEANFKDYLMIAGTVGAALIIGKLGYRLVKYLLKLCPTMQKINHAAKNALDISPSKAQLEFSSIKISQADLGRQDVLDKKLAQACKAGFFYLEMPAECQSLISKAVVEGNSFYQNEKYRKLRLEGFSGYHDRKDYQIESLYLEQKFWKEQLSDDLCKLATKMKLLAIDLLKKTLKACDISEKDFEKASGGVTEDKGQMHFTFNHYRSDKKNEGLVAHRDFGQITVLYIDKKGLQAKINGVWQEVLPLQNHFVINFGQALETLVNNPSKLVAAWHRVPQMECDRISMGVFADNHNQSFIYRKESNGSLTNTGDSYETYLKDGFKRNFPENS